jgi:hypothetical protein
MSSRTSRAKLHCVICGASKKAHLHHGGGRRHVPWFLLPLCKTDHDLLHELARQLRIDFKYTADPVERRRRALSALTLCQWMILSFWQRQAGDQ